jgi:hypothetical protein
MASIDQILPGLQEDRLPAQRIQEFAMPTAKCRRGPCDCISKPLGPASPRLNDSRMAPAGSCGTWSHPTRGLPRPVVDRGRVPLGADAMATDYSWVRGPTRPETAMGERGHADNLVTVSAYWCRRIGPSAALQRGQNFITPQVSLFHQPPWSSTVNSERSVSMNSARFA